jgi:hypothetical protein
MTGESKVRRGWLIADLYYQEDDELILIPGVGSPMPRSDGGQKLKDTQ